ncbi:MAG: hypothetical protein RIS47_2303 [Bacteroidota bacterium]|jgi:hypothetical protein
MAFVKFLVVLLLIYYLLKLLYNIIVPEPIRRLISQMRQAMRHSQGFAPPASPPRKPEGSVTIKKPSDASINKSKDGEYVDYEEVD